MAYLRRSIGTATKRTSISPIFTTPALGTPASGVGTNLTSVGAWVKLQEEDASTSATMTMGSSSIFSSTYDLYAIVITAMKPSAGNNSLRGRYYIAGSLKNSSYYRWNNIHYYGSTSSYTADQAGNDFDISININTGVESGGDNAMNSIIYVHTPAKTDTMTLLRGDASSFDSANKPTHTSFTVGYVEGSGVNIGACTGVQLYMSSGTITSGKFCVYGIAN